MERELQRLLDKEQISDLIYAYCTHLDLNEPERVGALFTEDCVTDYGAALGGPTHGRDRLQRGVAAPDVEVSGTSVTGSGEAQGVTAAGFGDSEPWTISVNC